MYNIAIDGPAGAGKSTVAKLVARELGFLYVDTGAMYRALAYACLKQGVQKEDEGKVTQVSRESRIGLSFEDGTQIVLLNGENVNPYIRTEEVSAMTSSIAVYPGVREVLLEKQRNIARECSVVMDGRDIGTNVLPDADLKIYLTASVETRAKRRYLEQKEKGEEVSLKEIEREIRERDDRDMTRETAPLKQAEDAVYLDSSDLSAEEVTAAIVALAG